MNDLHRNLLRDLPDRHMSKAGDFNTEARSVRAWVEALPLANFSATARMLVEALRAMNRMRTAPAERLEALEILRAPVNQLANLVEKQIVGASFPLPPQRTELGILAQKFQNELSRGYRIALHDFCAPTGNAPMLRRKQVAIAAVRALVHGGARLHRAYLLYRTPPPGAWQDLHDTYRFIESLSLDTRSVDDSVVGAPTTAKTAYAHVLLLALANPYRYTQRDLLEVIALTGTFATYCDLGNKVSDEAARYAVDLEHDSGPGYLPEERLSATPGVLSVGLGGVLQYIESQVASLPPGIRLATFRMRGGPAVQVDIELAQRLVDGWGSGGERGDVRLPGGHVLQSVIGLHDLHFVLAGNEDFESFLRRVRGTSIQMSDNDSAAAWMQVGSDPLRSQPIEVQVLDQGFGGYRVLWERRGPGEAVRAKVGELVGLALPEAGGVAPDWMIGVIRWMRIDDEARIDAGISLLARRSLAVGISALDAEANPINDRRGILLSPIRSEESAIYSSLLTPGLFERSAPSIRLTLPEDPHRWPSSACTLEVNGAGLMESAGAYLRFALPPLDLPDEGLQDESEDAELENEPV
jgi:cyclic-di-GMP-binding protein